MATVAMNKNQNDIENGPMHVDTDYATTDGEQVELIKSQKVDVKYKSVISIVIGIFFMLTGLAVVGYFMGLFNNGSNSVDWLNSKINGTSLLGENGLDYSHLLQAVCDNIPVADPEKLTKDIMRQCKCSKGKNLTVNDIMQIWFVIDEEIYADSDVDRKTRVEKLEYYVTFGQRGNVVRACWLEAKEEYASQGFQMQRVMAENKLACLR